VIGFGMLQRFYLTIASIPGLPPLLWRITRRSRPVFLPAMRVVQCTFDYFNRTGSLPPSVFRSGGRRHGGGVPICACA
jgi:hypothetical protein